LLHSASTLFTTTTTTTTFTTTTTNMNGQPFNFTPAGQAFTMPVQTFTGNGVTYANDIDMGGNFPPVFAPGPVPGRIDNTPLNWLFPPCARGRAEWFRFPGNDAEPLLPGPYENPAKVARWIDSLDARSAARCLNGFGGEIRPHPIAKYRHRFLFSDDPVLVMWSPMLRRFLADPTCQDIELFRRNLRKLYGLDPIFPAQEPPQAQMALPVQGFQNNLAAQEGFQDLPAQAQGPAEGWMDLPLQELENDLVLEDLIKGWVDGPLPELPAQGQGLPETQWAHPLQGLPETDVPVFWACDPPQAQMAQQPLPELVTTAQWPAAPSNEETIMNTPFQIVEPNWIFENQ
jgi:hypothetical protein